MYLIDFRQLMSSLNAELKETPMTINQTAEPATFLETSRSEWNEVFSEVQGNFAYGMEMRFINLGK